MNSDNAPDPSNARAHGTPGRDTFGNGDRVKLESLSRRLADLHHDLQNPLSVLTGNVELVNELSRELEVDPAISQSLDDIHAASIMLIEMLGQLKSIRAELD